MSPAVSPDVRRVDCFSGYGRCWWAHPSAAELPHQEAQALRQDRCQHLQIRCLMPQAMLELTLLEPESAQADAGILKPDDGHANGKEQQQAGKVQGSGSDI